MISSNGRQVPFREARRDRYLWSRVDCRHLTEESTRITQYGFKRGAVSYVRLLTSQQNLAAVRKEYTALLQSLFVAVDALEAAVGQPLPQE